MKWFKLIFFLLISLSLEVTAQNQNDFFNIQNFKSDVAITFNAQSQSSYILSDYGSINSAVGSSMNNYIFQGQEFDKDLGLHFFPSRIYSARGKRFYQPDPKSQYHSSYLFVNADPVNRVDNNGNEGKPIVFYGEDHTWKTSMDESIKDLGDALDEDAYYVPLSDLLNGEVGDLPEWNGNVFIDAHMGLRPGAEIEVESAKSLGDLKTSSRNAQHLYSPKEGKFTSRIDAEGFGKSLRRFADERRVSVRNITSGGCQGGVAGERIGQGYANGGSRIRGETLTVKGAKTDRYCAFLGNRSTSDDEGSIGSEETRFYVGSKDYHAKSEMVEDEFGDEVEKFDSVRMNTSKVEDIEAPYAKESELRDLVNGRVPKSVSHEFETFKFSY